MTKRNTANKFEKFHTLIIGSGAAGLNAALQLQRRGITDIAILTEGLQKGTSINTGSDKQTYYKLSLCGADADAPMKMARTYFSGGSMHGDLALVEASLSAQSFLNLVNLGVKFPQDAYGQFAGYKTDHDPARRATSVGPYTSRDMCRSLIAEIKKQRIRIIENQNVVSLATIGTGKKKRIAGAVAISKSGKLSTYAAANIVFATGGPGGLYRTSVYPAVHTGGIGLAMLAGATCQSLPESQYGLASTKFRWNVSGTYMQVIPRFVSTDAAGKDEKEFLSEYFSSMGEMNSLVFLKGYQWPFDPRKVCGGSSIIDILVYIETVVRGRRVWLDYRSNPVGYKFSDMTDETKQYLKNSTVEKLKNPLMRLRKMNPGAIGLYSDHKIYLDKEMLEIAVCAQHNNGGLASNHWWESPNLQHFFPVGEVNGSHGVYRPGGSALNAGQVGSLRAAEYIANCYSKNDLPLSEAKKSLAAEEKRIKVLCKAKSNPNSWREEREEFQSRMSSAAAHIRSEEHLNTAVKEATIQWKRVATHGGGFSDSPRGMAESLRNIQLCFAHLAYLQATLAQVKAGTGSRGSALIISDSGVKAHKQLGDEWKFAKEDESFREKILQTSFNGEKISNNWIKRREIPTPDDWFENVWADFRSGKIYR